VNDSQPSFQIPFTYMKLDLWTVGRQAGHD
jgi:hypothetical protein